MKSLYDLALETVMPGGGALTENQENEIDALVQFGKRVLENAAQQGVQADGATVPLKQCYYCDDGIDHPLAMCGNPPRR